MGILDGSPSAKALGKRPVPPPASVPCRVLDIALEAEATVEPTSGVGQRTRRRRTAVSRSGAPSFGASDTDVSILEAMERKSKNESSAPVNLSFLLTTDSSAVPPKSSSSSDLLKSLGLNLSAFERYFERPEVIESCMKQTAIEVPEFNHVPDYARVGGRLRARGYMEKEFDTSDAAYERRHRKYEMIEKRQRLREKEQFAHKHYKLQERIEQLRAMDPSVFAIIPDMASSSLSPQEIAEAAASHGEVDGTPNRPNGSDEASEGERKKQEVLKAAEHLESRYRRLLVPRERKTPGKVAEIDSEEVYTPSLPLTPAFEETKVNKEPSADIVEPEPQPIFVTAISRDSKGKFKIKIPPLSSRKQALPWSSPISSRSRRRTRNSQVEHIIDNMASETSMQNSGHMSFLPSISTSIQSPLISSRPRRTRSSQVDYTLDNAASDHSMQYLNPSMLPPSISISAFSPSISSGHDSVDFNGQLIGDSDFVPPRKKKAKRSSRASAAHKSSTAISKDGFNSHPHIRNETSDSVIPKSLPAILVAAMRNSDSPNVRKTARHITAFGFKLPENLEQLGEFRLPDDVLPVVESMLPG